MAADDQEQRASAYTKSVRDMSDVVVAHPMNLATVLNNSRAVKGRPSHRDMATENLRDRAASDHE